MAKVALCTDCQSPIVGAFDERTGMVVQLDLEPVASGPYEIVGDGIMRQRRTKTGKPARGGKGHRPHTCRAVELAGIGRIEDPPVVTAQVAGTYQVGDKPVLAEAGQIIPPELPPEPAGTPAAIIELEAIVGPQETTRTVEWEGSLGRTACGLCGAPIIAALSQTDNVVLLHDVKLDAGPWRAYVKDGTPRAEFRSAKDTHACYVNHRLLCEEAHA